MTVAHSWVDSHPTPSLDPLLNGVDHAERCGFGSREALYQWFDGYTSLLHECGFREYVYEVPDADVRVGQVGQAVFSSLSASEVSVTELAHAN
ncbi:hypothetical protein [Sphaerisporangium siamense]|uniref:Uncharacterized protein n=1 Tax=Sphaerisporangium siamense TaxID=795645 RepID=A0A7W7DBG6_9ACTN|nr:hypothetical protein [Sphaerisporangium siamense]MBB4702920.1 hypothetical protein [Sphaerisporangium siamense]